MNTGKHLRRLGSIAVALLFGALLVAPALAAPVEPSMPEEIARFYQAGQYTQAVEALQAAVGKSPQDASLHYWLGRSFFELRDFGRAISSMERAVSIEPGNSEYHHWLGIACGRKAEESNPFSAFTLALRTHHEFQTAVHLDRENLAAQRDLIRYLLAAPVTLGGGDDHALQQMADLALVDPIQADLARGEYFTARKKFDQAGQQYQKIMLSKSNNPGVYLEVALYYRDRGDAHNMQTAVDAAEKASPSDRRLEYYRGVALVLANKNGAEAEKHLRTYLASVPSNSDFPPQSSAHEYLGELYEEQSRPDQAAAEFQAALALDPRNRGLRDAIKRVQHE